MTTDPTITIAGLRAAIEREYYREQARTMAGEIVELQAERRGHAAELQSLTAERDALAAQLAEVRATVDRQASMQAELDRVSADRVRIDCERADAVSELARTCRDLTSERAHLAACQTRIAGLEQAANERSAEVARLTADYMTVVDAIMPRSDGPAHAAATARSHRRHIDELEAEVARLTARVAELEARPVLTAQELCDALVHARAAGDFLHVPAAVAADVANRIVTGGPVTLPPAQDDPMRHHESRDYALQSPANGYWPADVGAVNGTEALAMGAMLRSVGPHPISDAALLAMARAAIECVDKLGAPPTSPPAARPVFAEVSEDELIRLFYVVGTDGIDHGEQCPPIDSSDRNGLRAVLARLEVSLVAPVDPEKIAADITGPIGDRVRTGEWKRIKDAARTALTAAGIPVTPERGK